MRRVLFLTFLCLLFVSCSKITILRTRELTEVRTRVDSLRSEITAMEQSFRTGQEEEFRTHQHHRVAVEIALDRLSEMLFQIAGNVTESQTRVFELTRVTDLIAIQMAERARQDSLVAAVKEKERMELFNLARSNFDRGNFALAVNDFRDYAERYPDSQDALAAKFWRAESYFSMDSLETAKKLFQEFYRDNREGNFACSALHRLGLIFH